MGGADLTQDVHVWIDRARMNHAMQSSETRLVDDFSVHEFHNLRAGTYRVWLERRGKRESYQTVVLPATDSSFRRVIEWIWVGLESTLRIARGVEVTFGILMLVAGVAKSVEPQLLVELLQQSLSGDEAVLFAVAAIVVFEVVVGWMLILPKRGVVGRRLASATGFGSALLLTCVNRYITSTGSTCPCLGRVELPASLMFTATVCGGWESCHVAVGQPVSFGHESTHAAILYMETMARSMRAGLHRGLPSLGRWTHWGRACLQRRFKNFGNTWRFGPVSGCYLSRVAPAVRPALPCSSTT